MSKEEIANETITTSLASIANAVTACDTKFSDLASFVKTLPTDDKDNGIYYDNCKLCKSSFKPEVHDLADRGTSHLQIHRWLVDKKEDISYGAVHNHLIRHYGVKNDNRKLVDYANQISKWGELAKTDEILLNRYITMLDREATLLLAEGKEVDLQERRKNVETAMKVAQLIGSFREQLHKLQAEKRPVELVIISLNRIIQMKLDNGSSPEVRKVLMDVIDQLKKEVGDLDIEGDANG